MQNKKILYYINYITLVLLSILLMVCLVRAWYVTNKEVNAREISGFSKDNTLEIKNCAIFQSLVGEDGSAVDKPSDNVILTGLLSGDRFYYGVTLTTKNGDNRIRNLDFTLYGINGGCFFTKSPVELQDTNYTEVQGELYETYAMVAKEDGTYTEEKITYKLYTDNLTSARFYITEDNSVKYKNYIYENENGYCYNTCDVFFVKLDCIYLTNGEVSTKYSLNGSNTLESLYTLGNLDENYNSLIDLSRTDGHSHDLTRKQIGSFYNWDPNEYPEITVIFSVLFDMSTLPNDIAANAVSRRSLIINYFNISDTFVINEEDQ